MHTNLERVRERIAAAAIRSGRKPAEITLVAVTKTHPPEVVAAAYELGLRDIGENRVEEALRKQAVLPPDLRWHMIGHIQRRKARDVVGNFHLVHSVDSLRLAEELEKRARAVNVLVDILLEVNVTGEASKYGFQATTPAERDTLVAAAAALTTLPSLRVRGLMTMAPFVADPEETRPFFAAVRHLRERLRRELPAHEWAFLSMGMTNDFEVAIEEGATHVRIGTAIFGERETPA
ncbi:MAG: YggS family pyridoxal phosphate-dependent enzyme [Ardenticatenaceae bacterium]|nr:YggS family pyridoxal phosphate-dependent enzyme [Ardenticatenaceae bacterium]